jgi:shikimate kinase
VRLALVGAPGAGKSAIAADLEGRWGVPFIDTDAVYAQRSGVGVADAVIDDEAAFRAVEEQIVLEALATDDAVVAVGSGALGEPVLEALRGVPVVWLEVGLAEASRRTGLSGMRPLSMGPVRAQMADMMAARASIYASVADLTVNTDRREVAGVADEIELWEAQR